MLLGGETHGLVIPVAQLLVNALTGKLDTRTPTLAPTLQRCALDIAIPAQNLLQARIIYRREHVGIPRLRAGRPAASISLLDHPKKRPATSKHERTSLRSVAKRSASAAAPGTSSRTVCVTAPVIHLPSIECPTWDLTAEAEQKPSRASVSWQGPHDGADILIASVRTFDCRPLTS